MHCMASWFAFLVVYKKQPVARWYQVFSFAAAIVIFVSTVAVKQHFFVDIAAGIAVAQIFYLVAAYTNVCKPVAAALN